ncbi:MAG: DUF2782 domain-containing protein [Acidiferrobacterales bacterium]|nr:DUF2782 domain-containing protein [Acidiferrobacterales bacterium]
MRNRIQFLLATLSLLSTLALDPLTAADKQAVEPGTEVPEPPPLPPANVEDTYLEPEITIVVSKQTTQYEYRINGRLYMVKVVPQKGKPYYLIDPDGTGQWRRSFSSDIVPPQWVIKEF